MLRSRSSKREESLDVAIPDFIVIREGNPQDEVALPFEEIAAIIGRSSTAARKLASRARRRVQGAAMPDKDTARQRRAVDAFVAAAQTGDLESLIAVLDPKVVLLADRGPALKGIHGADVVAKQALEFSKLVQKTESVIVNGTPGIMSWLPNGKPMAVLCFVVSNDRIAEIYVLSDPNRLQRVIERS